MVDIDHKTFYTRYAYDYHLYKVMTLFSILENQENFQSTFFKQNISQFDATDYARYIKWEIRMTCFHAVETLFELIFGLEPRNGKCRDYDLLKAISTSNFSENYKRIERISKDENELAFLDSIVPQFDRNSLWKHIFFFSIPPEDNENEEITKLLDESNEAIRMFLREAARMFSARLEYNAYKHGIRALNAFNSFGISDLDGKKAFKFDLSDSISFFSVEKEKGVMTNEVISTKILNTEKDVKMILLAGQLIYNIIQRRRWAMVPDNRPAELLSTNFLKSAVLDMIQTHNQSSSMRVNDLVFRKSMI